MNASPSSSESQGTTTTGQSSPKQEEIIGRLIDKALGNLSWPSPVKRATVVSEDDLEPFFKIYFFYFKICGWGVRTRMQVPTEELDPRETEVIDSVR